MCMYAVILHVIHTHTHVQAVIPLHSASGIVEWVDNTHGLRSILHQIYQ